MHVTRMLAFVLAAALGVSATASAQRRVPATGSAAVGGEIGAYMPIHEPLDSGLTLEGFYEYYFDPRTSMRIGLGWAEPGFPEDEDSLRIVRVPFEMVYNWDRGDLHPFAGAGIGAYFLQAEVHGHGVGDAEAKLGAALFAGAEFFNSRSVSVKAELKYHIIDDIRGLEPDGFSLTIGLKKYF